MTVTRRGFTMLELLVVIAIIGILVSMLFPVFARSREMARAAQCASSVAELGLALQMYAADWNGVYPPREDDLGPIAERVRADAVFRCPSSRFAGLTREELTVLAAAKHVRDLSGPMSPGASSTPALALADGRLLGSGYYYHAGLTTESPPGALLVTEREAPHLGGAYVLYASGEVKRVPEAEWRPLIPIAERRSEQDYPPQGAPYPGGLGRPGGGGTGRGGRP